MTNLLNHLEQRLQLLRHLTSKKIGVSMPIARTFYLFFIQSIINYHALYLCSILDHYLTRLDKLQNKAMRLILGCPVATWIFNMKKELHLPSMPDRVKTLGTTIAVKCISTPQLASHFVSLLQEELSRPTGNLLTHLHRDLSTSHQHCMSITSAIQLSHTWSSVCSFP